MGKQKKKLSDRKYQKRRPLGGPIKKDNPFEKRKLSKKHIIVGQRLKSQESIGQSRSQALDQRKKTLLIDYQQRGHVNAFIDKRIGENDETLTNEEKMLIRYQKEKQKKLLKKTLFSLDDTEEGLTHLGQSLSELDTFDDYMNDDYDDDEITGEIVSDYHFGGGLFKKVSDDSTPRNREEIMKEVVAKSKYYKQLHQREREESIALTEELDDDLTNLLPHLSNYWRDNNDNPTKDDFDLLTKELAFETRAIPLNRLPTEEEIAKKQRDRLELLEKERIKRMKGEESEESEDSNDNDDNEINEDNDNEMSDNDSKTKQKKEYIKPLTDKELKLIDESLKEDSIPFLIHVPKTLHDLQILFNKKESKDIRIIIARMIASNNAKLGPQYKEHIQRLFKLLFEYFEWKINTNNTNNDNNIDHLTILDIISHTLYTILPSITNNATTYIKAKLIELHQLLDEYLQLSNISNTQEASKSLVWTTSDFYIFKLLSNLYPVTDFQHPIITPSLLLMTRYITFLPVLSLYHIISKLFLSSMIYHYISPSKRFVPEVLSFLQLILLSCLNQKQHSLFTSTTKDMPKLLFLRVASKREKKLVSQYQISPLNICNVIKQVNTGTKPAPLMRYQVLFNTITLIDQFSNLYEDYECYIEIFTPFSNLLHALENKAIPPQVYDYLITTTLQIDNKIKKDLNERVPMTFKNLKPMPLRTLAPEFIEHYVPGRDYDKNQERARIRALKKRVKSEKKGAMRELRKDNYFIENERLQQKIEEDKERKDKLKQIMHQLETEQHHFNVAKMKANTIRK